MNTLSKGKINWRSYQVILRLALPIVIQNLFSAAVSSADVIMLNSVGQSSISAVSLAVQYSSVLYMVYYGLGTGSTMLCAQYWGRGNLEAIEKVDEKYYARGDIGKLIPRDENGQLKTEITVGKVQILC